MLKLYGRNTSINVQKAAWAMGEAGLEWEWFDKDGVFGTVDVPNYAEINPQIRIPTLDDDGLLVRQSNAIVRYIARNYGQEVLLPKDEPTYVEAERWMEWQASDNWRPMVVVFWGLIRTPKGERNMVAIEECTGILNEQFGLLNDYLADRAYVTGDTFTMGDIPPGAAVYRYYAMDIERPDYPYLERWYETLQKRETYRDLVMVLLA